MLMLCIMNRFCNQSCKQKIMSGLQVKILHASINNHDCECKYPLFTNAFDTKTKGQTQVQ